LLERRLLMKLGLLKAALLISGRELTRDLTNTFSSEAHMLTRNGDKTSVPLRGVSSSDTFGEPG